MSGKHGVNDFNLRRVRNVSADGGAMMVPGSRMMLMGRAGKLTPAPDRVDALWILQHALTLGGSDLKATLTVAAIGAVGILHPRLMLPMDRLMGFVSRLLTAIGGLPGFRRPKRLDHRIALFVVIASASINALAGNFAGGAVHVVAYFVVSALLARDEDDARRG